MTRDLEVVVAESAGDVVHLRLEDLNLVEEGLELLALLEGVGVLPVLEEGRLRWRDEFVGRLDVSGVGRRRTLHVEREGDRLTLLELAGRCRR